MQPTVRLPSPQEVFLYPGFLPEKRDSQIEMSNICLATMISKGVSIVEAPTGTGKGLAYLLASVLYSNKYNSRIVVSTATNALQDQLFNKDIPYLKDKLENMFNLSFRASMLKGRNHYLCKLRYNNKLSLISSSVPKYLIEWEKTTETGDKSELGDRYCSNWGDFDADFNGCNEQCPFKPSTDSYDDTPCFYYKARKIADRSNIIVSNHALTALSIIDKDRGPLPDFDVLVVDEAHQFEKYMLSALTNEVSFRDFIQILNLSEDILKLGIDLIDDVRDSFTKLVTIKEESYLLNIEPNNPVFLKFKNGISLIKKYHETSSDPRSQELDKPLDNLTSLVRNMDNKNNFTRVEYKYQGSIKSTFPPATLLSGPVNVSNVLKDKLYKDKTVIFTSATLSSNGNFSYFKNMMGVTPLIEKTLLSPFDYKKQCLLYLPNGPYPNYVDKYKNEEYKNWFVNEVRRLLLLNKGRAFVLFTSYTHLNHAFSKIADKSFPYPIKKQGDGNKEYLLKWFTETKNSIIFGTKTFWEGVSVDGDALSLVIIDKMPFKSEKDPLVLAKAQHYNINNVFDSLLLPEAILDLKQGFGRLIRTINDKGVIAILDPRINTSSYKNKVIRSLPNIRVENNYSDSLFKEFLPVD